MAREQFGICAEASLHGYYLLFNVLEDKNAHVRQALSRLPALFNKYADRFSEANLAGVIAIGANYWDELYPAARPKQLKPFAAIECDDRAAPADSYDLYIEIRSDRADVNHIVSTKVCALLANSVELVEQVRAFRFLDGRDLIAQSQSGTGKTGTFIIGTIERVDSSKSCPQTIILSPTRELAKQIDMQIEGFSYFTNSSLVLSN